MGWTRREFLRQTALFGLALGLSETGLTLLTRRYQQVLAQPTARKLALLVGINQYPEQVSDIRSPVRGSALTGCLTDVELQRELLIHRFGFQPSDVLTLTDQQATRQAIADAFQAHLIEQAQPGDVVVFHFSGLGSRVKLGARGSETHSTLVPVDGILPTEEQPTLNDLPQETLDLLLGALPTDRVTAVLDLGYSNLGKSLWGNLRIRSRPHAPTGQLSETEQRFQEQLRQRASASGQRAVLTAAQPGQVALEGQWSGFSAGLFTYALTQQLWLATPATTLQVSLKRAARAIEQRVGDQQPEAQTARPNALPYDIPADATAADGVITAVGADGTVQLWLAGIPAIAIDDYGAGSLLSSADHNLLLQVRSREGLRATATVVSTAAPAILPEVGQRMQEVLRVLPRDIGLTVALDSALERIERVDATSAFAALPHVVTIAAADQPADYRFGKTQPAATALTAALPTELADDSTAPQLPAPRSGYGLFLLGQSAVPNTLIEADEAVKTAVNRLAPQLRTLLAMKLLRLTENSGSSRLGVRASLEVAAPQAQLLSQQETARAPHVSLRPQRREAIEPLPQLSIGSRVQYRLHNDSDRPIYFVLIGLDSSGSAVAFYPAPDADDVSDCQIAPGKAIVLPGAESSSGWVVRGPAGLIETHLVCSSRPLAQTTATLTEAMSSLDSARRISALSKPLEVAQAVLQDLHQASGTDGESAASGYALHVAHWATFSFAYRTVASGG